MDPISGAIGMIAAIPQCIEAAKQLYDLRERFDQAAVLITAIYTESMVVAASLSQIQGLLHGTTLQSKPELRDTLDRALTGCWIVYQCLEEEVRDLVQKVDVNDLRKRDRARFLLKEANFKELLQQIRGQQSALGLLIQGLQMESISDMHRLLGDNSMKLDQIAKRSNTLRQKHPNIKVPESVLDTDSIDGNQSIFGDAEFAFDDEVVNSKAYRRAMARATTRKSAEEPEVEAKVIEGDLIDLESVPNVKINESPNYQQLSDEATADMNTLMLQINDAIESHNNGAPPPYDDEIEEDHADMLDDLEKSLLPFMPPASLSSKPSVVITETKPTHVSPDRSSIATRESTTATLVSSLGEEVEKNKGLPETKDKEEEEKEGEKPPPLPPRRSASSYLEPARSGSSSELKKVSSWEEIFSPLSNTSSLSLTDPFLGGKDVHPKSAINRKPLPTLIKKTSSSSFYASRDGEQGLVTSTREGDLVKVWASILSDEDKYIERMNKLCTTFYETVVKEWPALEKHLEAIGIAGKLIPLHQQYIIDAVKEQISKNPSGTCDPRLFITWASQTYRLVKEYSQRYPHALYALRLTRSRDNKFNSYIERLGLSLTYFGKSWEDYILLPIMQLESYITKLQSMIELAQKLLEPIAIKDESRLKAALAVLQKLKAQSGGLAQQSFNREEVQSLHRRIHTVDTSLVDVLNLAAPDRRIVHQGSFGIKLNGHGPWLSTHLVLLDNYLLWGKMKPPKAWKHQDRKGDDIWVIDQPVPVTHLAIRLPIDSRQIQKTSYLDELPRGVTLYEIFIDVVITQSNFTTHILGIFSYEDRNDWYQKLSAVAGKTPPKVPI